MVAKKNLLKLFATETAYAKWKKKSYENEFLLDKFREVIPRFLFCLLLKRYTVSVSRRNEYTLVERKVL